MFAKYLSADGCFVKTNTINCDDNDDATYFLILGRLLLLALREKCPNTELYLVCIFLYSE